MQYSVSRPRRRNSFGPKPKLNVITRTPNSLANMKCPNSCTKMSELISMMK